MELKAYLQVIVKFLQEEVKKAKAQGLIVGLSGGIDSAVAARLIQQAFPDNHLCLILPCDSDPIDSVYAQNLVNKHKLISQKIDLTSSFTTLKTNLTASVNQNHQHLIFGNMKARLRMTTLYALAQNLNYLVVGTDNADEWYTGYFTKYGDGGVDLLPIVRLLKKDIIASAKLLDVTTEIVQRSPSASLYVGQTDEKEMDFKYEQLDNYLLNNTAYLQPEVIAKIKSMHTISEHKRVAIPQAPIWKRK